ncbi:MAG: S9 family peptidase [Calditrichaceae bacterium]
MSKNIFLFITLCVVVSFFYQPVSLAGEIDSTLLTIDRIFLNREFSAKGLGQTQWFDNGDSYTKLESSNTNETGEDIVRYDVLTGDSSIIVPAGKLIPEGDSLALDIASYSFTDDQKKLLIFTNTKKVWRRNTRGDYYVLDLSSWDLTKLGGEAKPSTLMFATFSPDNKKVAYVCENNLYVEQLDNHKIKALTKSGSETIINGTFDWVYEEELGLRNGFRWSPDGKHIAYWQLDAEGVGVFYMINNTDSIYSRIIPVQYPKVGTTNSACRVGVVSADGGKTKWFDIPGDSRNHYIGYMEWAASSEEVLIQQLNREQNTNKVLLGYIKSGKVNNIFTDKDDAWVRIINDVKWFEDGKYFTWLSDRDGWRHIYTISRSGDQVSLITKGNFDVIDVLNIDETSGWIYFRASPDNPTQKYLYRINIKNSNSMERVTPGDQAGTHSYKIAPNLKYAFHSWSNINTPATHELIELPSHKTIRVIEDNHALKKKLSSLKISDAEFFKLEIEPGVQLDGYMIKPYNFDPSKKYPVLFYVYGEPSGQTVLDSYGRGTGNWHHMLTQMGYIIISVDNRGTPGPLGRQWRKYLYKQIGILNSADQAAAVRNIREWDFIDSTRIGVWGWSGGGTMSLNCIFRYPELYQTAMAVAAVSDERLYDTIYQERYMGLQEDNLDNYIKGSAVTYANQLEGNLLLIHGTNDDNVHYQNFEVLVNELIKQNKMFTAVPYPNRTHSIYRRPNSRRHVFETLTWYLTNHLPPVPVD